MVRHVIAISLALTLLVGGSHAADIELRGIGWIVLRSKNPERLAEYYKTIGFEEWARSPRIIGLKAGGGAVLEIGRLDAAAPDPKPQPSRTYVQQAAIIGSKQARLIAERAAAAGAAFIESYDSGGVTIFYVADIDGNVIGFAEDGPMWGNTNELRQIPDVKIAPGARP